MPTLLDTILGAVQHEASAYTASMTEFVAPWLKRFLLHSVPKMKEVGDAGVGCEGALLVPGGAPQPCQAQACLYCAACGKPTCLAHAFVNFQSDAICGACVMETCREKRRRIGAPAPPPHRAYVPPGGQAPPPREERRAPPPPPRGVTQELMARAAAANKTLGIEAWMEWPQIEKRYKILLKKYHPDTYEPAHRPAAEAKYKEVRSAWDTLIEFREKAGMAA